LDTTHNTGEKSKSLTPKRRIASFNIPIHMDPKSRECH
jgi:hypothetical protein